jgi:DNA-binding NarL/FixJ family response regulator
VLLVDDDPRVRHGIARMLEGHCQLCGEAENGAEAVWMVRELDPDVVLLDVRMPVMDGTETARAIHQISPATKIVLISVDDSPHIGSLVKLAGADGFVSKNCGSKVFTESIDRILRCLSATSSLRS